MPILLYFPLFVSISLAIEHAEIDYAHVTQMLMLGNVFLFERKMSL